MCKIDEWGTFHAHFENARPTTITGGTKNTLPCHSPPVNFCLREYFIGGHGAIQVLVRTYLLTNSSVSTVQGCPYKGLALLDELGLELRVTVARHVDLHLPALPPQRLRRRPVAGVLPELSPEESCFS